MRIVVTGSKGFIGKEVMLKCEKLGIDAVGVDLPMVDICSEHISEVITNGTDAIIHLAALSKDSDCRNRAYECFKLNVMGTLNLINAAEKKNVKQFIFASSEWVYDNCSEKETKTEESLINIANHKSEYALSKLVTEANLRQKYQYGFCSTTILRFGIIYANRKENGSAVETLYQSVKQGNEIAVGSLRTGRHFIHISDLVDGIIKSIGLNGFEIINLVGDKLITLQEIIETSKTIFHKNPRIIEKDFTNPSIRRISNEKAKILLGWKPQVDLEIGLIKNET